MNTPAKRNTCFAIISSIEEDLRAFIRHQCHILNISDVLPSDVRESAVKRWESDNRSSVSERLDDDFELLDYADFMDIKKSIDKSLRPEQGTIDVDLKELTTLFEKLSPIRNRVCHARPLEPEDFTNCFDAAEELLKFRGIEFSSLKRNIELLKESPTHALQLQIPTFWFAGNEISHNLPQTEFDETGFIGRKNDVKSVLNLLKGNHNIITITGEGGVGKTALALRCLYNLLDTPSPPFDVIVWVSLKTKKLTASGITDVHDAVTDTLGLFQSVSTNLGTATDDLETDALISEIIRYLENSKVLVAIDNLETLAGDDILYSLLERGIPSGSKVLFTSRVRLGILEMPYTLEPLDPREACTLMRSFSKALSEGIIGKATQTVIEKYCKNLFFNPLLIKWFVESVARGSSPDSLLNSDLGGDLQKALSFCCSSLLNKLNADEKAIIEILAAARVPLTFIKLSYIYSEGEHQRDIEQALGLLHNSCLVKREPLPSGGYEFRLSEPLETYISTNSPPEPDVFRDVQNKIVNLRKQAEYEQVRREQYQFDVFSIRADNSDEKIIAMLLRQALEKIESENPDIDGARDLINRAKSYAVTHAETYRVAGLVESKVDEPFKARVEYDQAVEYDSQSSIIRYTYAQFHIREGNFEDALGHLDIALRQESDSTALIAAKALALTRLYRCAEAADLYNSLLESLNQKQKSIDEDEVLPRFRISTYDQTAECYRRWAETDSRNNDYQKFKEHIGRAFDILKAAISVGDSDFHMLKKIEKILCDAVNQACQQNDEAYAKEVVQKIRDLGQPLRIPRTDSASKTFNKMQTMWPSLYDEMKDLCGEQLDYENQTEPIHPVYRIGERLNGTVKHEEVKNTKSYGFIHVPNRMKPIFFHRTSLVNKEQWLFFRKQDTSVSFVVDRNEQGFCATKVAVPEGNLHNETFIKAFNDAKTTAHKTIITIVWVLFENDINGGEPEQPSLMKNWKITIDKNKLSNMDIDMEFAENAIRGIVDKYNEIDKTIDVISKSKVTEPIQRNILRLALLRLQFGKDYGLAMERSAINNETIEIAKNLLDEGAGGFIYAIVNSPELIRK